MKYKNLDYESQICWPRLNDDDIDWFRNQNDILKLEDREEIEEIWKKIKFSNKKKEKIFKSIDKIHKILKKYKHITKITQNVIDNFKVLLTDEFKLRNISTIKKKFIVKDKKKYNEFLKNGILTYKINDKLYKKLLNHLNDDILELKNMEKPEMIIFERGYLLERTKGVNKEGLKIINEIVNNLNLYPIMNKYYNVEFRLTSARLHRSTDEDEHPIQTLNDLIKDNPPRHKNLHIDPKLNIKCIIYLKDVNINDGPFSYIKGSHLFAKTPMVEKNFAKAINVFNINNTPEKRLEFLSLPKDLQKSSNIGNYILNESKNGKYIKENLTPILSSSGNLIFFEPDGMHLGGNCYDKGERIAIQVVFRPCVNS